MAYARFQATAQDAAGNVLPDASIEVRSEETGSLVTVYSDRAGVTTKGNPFLADGDGYFFFHAPGGSYRVKATKGSTTREWRYVAIGMAAESDAVAIPMIMLSQEDFDELDPPDPATLYYIVNDA